MQITTSPRGISGLGQPRKIRPKDYSYFSWNRWLAFGDLPDERMRQTAQSKGIKLESRARQFQSADFNRFNLVLAMDQSNLARLEEIAPSNLPPEKLMLFRSFDPECNGDQDVPDPYYGGTKGFEEVYSMVKRTCPPLLDYIKSRFLNL